MADNLFSLIEAQFERMRGGGEVVIRWKQVRVSARCDRDRIHTLPQSSPSPKGQA